MKKLAILIAAIALVSFSVPAMADWNFYGNSRMETFYTSQDFGDGTNAAGTDDKDSEIRWRLQGNSRVGVNVKAEAISGLVELGLKAEDDSVSKDGVATRDIGQAGDGDVGTRRIEGYWNFGAGRLGVAKGYTPMSQFISGQVFNSDNGLLGRGTIYAFRPGNISLRFGGFDVALITNAGDSDAGDLDGSLGASAGDVDVYLPKIEASYGMSFDTWNFAVRGGFQTYEIEDYLNAAGSTEDVTVTSWVLAADGGWNFGPGYLRGALSYGQNMSVARWLGGGSVLLDGDDDVEDVNTFQGALIAGIKVSDMMSFEGGFGYLYNDPNDAPSPRDESAQEWEVYVQGVFQLAPGMFIIPEVGYQDFGNDFSDVEKGSLIYAGAKWQINF